MNENIIIKNIIGFNDLENQFQKTVLSRKNQTWMLIGKRGIGKRTLSMRFAGYVINDFDVNWQNSNLTNEVFSKKSDNLFYITSLDEKSSGKISKEQIDSLSSKFKLFSYNSNNRVVIIDKFNWLTNSAMNSMLKILEEPPAGVYFFLIVDELKNVLPTIQSRSQKLFFKNLSLNECKSVLEENNILKEKNSINETIKLANYSPGLSYEISSIHGVQLYQELLDTFTNKKSIRNFSKKVISITKNTISNIWITELIIKRLLHNCLRFSVDKKIQEETTILNEDKVIQIIIKNKNSNDLLEILDDLNYRIKRVKIFNLSLELEVFQFLNKFH
ncbi:MAG: hypothetical protein ACJ0BU_00075 [Candidatus Puniceispirillales bacterium]